MAAKGILLVDPDESERHELQTVLARLGYVVETAADGKEGLRKYDNGHFEVVVVEVLLSGLNGLYLCKQLKERPEGKTLRVIVVSKIYQSRAMEYDAVHRYRADAYFARPFPLVRLIEKIGSYLGDPLDGPDAARVGHGAPAVDSLDAARLAEPAAALLESPPPDEGVFTPVLLGRILAKIGREKIDGMLELKHAEEVKHVYLVGGKPAFVKSSNPAESLGRMLVADGAISEEQYRSAIAEMNMTKKKFGTIIAARGFMTSDSLYYHLVNQTREKTARCFAWAGGEYRLDREIRHAPEATTFESDAFAVVLDGFRKFVDAGPIERDYERDKTSFLFPGDPAAAAAARQHLNADERALLAAAAGNRRLREVVGDSPLGLLSALRVVNALVCLGAIRQAPIEKRSDLSPYETEPAPTVEPLEDEPRGAERFRELKSLFVRMDDLSSHELLGVSPTAEVDEVRRAYVELEKKFHPDAFANIASERVTRMAAIVMRRLTQARDVLTDPVRRRERLRRQPPAGAVDKAEPAEPSATDGDDAPAANRRDAQRLFHEGQLAMEQKRYSLAVERLGKAAALFPKNAEYQVQTAMAMFKQLDEPGLTWDDVERALRHAMTETGERVDLLLLIGRTKARQRDFEAAMLYYKKALKLEPTNQECRREIRLVEQQLKKDGKKKSTFGIGK